MRVQVTFIGFIIKCSVLRLVLSYSWAFGCRRKYEIQGVLKKRNLILCLKLLNNENRIIFKYEYIIEHPFSPLSYDTKNSTKGSWLTDHRQFWDGISKLHHSRSVHLLHCWSEDGVLFPLKQIHNFEQIWCSLCNLYIDCNQPSISNILGFRWKKTNKIYQVMYAYLKKHFSKYWVIYMKDGFSFIRDTLQFTASTLEAHLSLLFYLEGCRPTLLVFKHLLLLTYLRTVHYLWLFNSSILPGKIINFK